MLFELRRNHPRCWVEELSYGDLVHYHAMEIASRSAALREQLHVAVTAAAVQADGGKMFEAMDQALAPKGEVRTGTQDEAPAPVRQMTEKDTALATSASASADKMFNLRGPRRGRPAA